MVNELEVESWRAYADANGYDIDVRVIIPKYYLSFIPRVVAPPPKPRYPVGKGLFIWQVGRCAGGDPVRAAALARSIGVQWVTLKIHDGTSHFNGEVHKWAEEFLKAGIESWGWGFNYGSDARGEARVAVERLRLFGYQGYLVNAEQHYKGQPAAAARWVAAFRELEPDMALGLCSYRYPSLHTDFPWAEFLAGCTFHAPQVYWLQAVTDTAPGLQLARSATELRNRKDLPIIPIGVAAPNDAQTWWPTLAQLRHFKTTAAQMQMPGYGWWEWGWAEGRPGFWAEL
jgi:hypothetical protein